MELDNNFPTVFEGGDARKLCARPFDPTDAAPKAIFGETPTTRLIPRNQWKPVDLSRCMSPIKNQNGIGECNFSATGNVLEACRRLLGLDHYDLSAGDGYSRINGGRDNGSLPEDALKIMMEEGLATTATVPYLHWRGEIRTPEVLAERKRFRILEALWCPTFEHAASALQQGYFLDTAVFWFDREPLNAEGWLGDRGAGNRGGHAIAGCGLMLREDGTWGVKIANSWTTNWGVNGYGVLPEHRCIEGTANFRWWAIRSVVQESGDLPVPNFPTTAEAPSVSWDEFL